MIDNSIGGIIVGTVLIVFILATQTTFFDRVNKKK